MATIILSEINASLPSVGWAPYRNNTTSSWSSIISGAGTHNGGYQGGVSFGAYGGNFTNCTSTGLIWDFRDLRFVTSINSAVYSFTATGNGSFPTNRFSTDEAGGGNLVSVDENYTVPYKDISMYNAIYRGRGTEYSTRKPFSTVPHDHDRDPYSYTLNAAGLSYLNSVHTKPNYKGLAFMGVMLNGIITAAPAPTIPGSGSGTHAFFQSTYNSVLTMNVTISSAHYINIGDSWKQVAGGLINVGDEWKSLNDLDLNVGDVWKNI